MFDYYIVVFLKGTKGNLIGALSVRSRFFFQKTPDWPEENPPLNFGPLVLLKVSCSKSAETSRNGSYSSRLVKLWKKNMSMCTFFGVWNATLLTL